MPASWLVPLKAEDIPEFYKQVRSSVTRKKKHEKGFFTGTTSIQFDNVEIEVLDKDILEIGYLIENKKIRLDFKLV